ncbi:DUF4012 domain-containing protein [Kitasatospora camelliae]|uniref:DUF4012 domain-containing protein n=1 Tax=Kitasatospora camelliae TaxID=3156397 RepID=A0AAU8JNL7_9ACTN
MRADPLTPRANEPEQAAGPARRPRPGRLILLGAAAILLPLAALSGAAALQARAVHSHLTAAHQDVARLAAAFAGGATPSEHDLASLREHTGAARRATSAPWWTALGELPLAGRSFRTAHGLSVAADEAATQVLPDAVRLREVADPARIMRQDGGVELDRLTAADPVLARIQTGLDRIGHNLAALPDATGIGRLDAARARLTAQVEHLAESAGSARTAVRLLPPLLGGSGPRSYFFAFQTNAEARGTGGLVGVFGILTADHGRITVHDLSSNDTLTSAPEPVADFGPDYESRYAADDSTRLMANSNLSAHFPYAAQIWTGLWRQKTGQQLDGAIATDPVGLARVLAATGPVRLPNGEQLTAADTVALTESTAYARYTDKSARKDFLIQVAHAVTDALLHGRHDPVALLRALHQLAGDGRLRMWSTDPQTQEALEDTELAGSVPQQTGPYAALVVNNSAGNKLDYYLDRSLRYELAPCVAGKRESVIRVRLVNNAPASGLPEYVRLRSDDPTHPHTPGSTRIWVSLYAAVGAQFRSAELDGRPLPMSVGAERGHPVLASEVELEPGQARELDIHLREPASARTPVVPEQPLVRPQTTQVIAAPCQEAP